jgi:cell wall-associated NlpC family hydrolase
VQHDRRAIVKGLGALAATVTAPAVASAQAPLPKAVPDFPDSQKFQTGDLLWPKKKGAYVPRTRSVGAAPPNEERKTWEAERQRALSEPQRAGLSPEVAEKLKTMRFDEFERLYHSSGAAPPSQGQATRGLLGDTISVGHVGIIEVGANGIAYVIEATPQGPGNASGVIRTRYADWLNAYANIQVWHGRLSALDESARAGVVKAALAQIGKPYDFFNFDLNDDSGFYCSKLVWQCLWRTAKIAADDNPDPQRGKWFPPWFSPKALIGVKRLTVLHKPGEY